MKLVITCEHGGNEIPEGQRHLFLSNTKVLQTHRGFDLGALDLYNQVSPLADFAMYSTTSRLLIELNRSLHHRNLFSEFSKLLSTSEKEEIITSYYSRYRNTITNVIQKYIEDKNNVVHISVHSFTPILDTIERNCDIGLLYDASLTDEKTFAHQVKTAILQQDATLNIRYNYPYLGKADGFTTYLRKNFSKNYIGIELEVNQKYTSNNLMHPAIKKALYATISTLPQ